MGRAQNGDRETGAEKKRRKLTGVTFKKSSFFYGIESIDPREFGTWYPPTVESGGLTSSSLAPFCARWPRHDANNKFRPYQEGST